MTHAEDQARRSFEADLAKDQASRQPLDSSWIGLRVYLRQDDGLWLYRDERSYHPPFLAFKLDADQIRIAPAVGLIRAAHMADRGLKHFQLEKLPYSLAGELKNMLEHGFGVKGDILNQAGRNYDPVYRSVILFVDIAADKAREYALEEGRLKWFTMADILRADEQDGKIIGMDTSHLQELAKLNQIY